jgi:hypothetical protein
MHHYYRGKYVVAQSLHSATSVIFQKIVQSKKIAQYIGKKIAQYIGKKSPNLVTLSRGFKFVFSKSPPIRGIYHGRPKLRAMEHETPKYIFKEFVCFFSSTHNDNSCTALQCICKFLKKLHPGGIRTRDLLFCRGTRMTTNPKIFSLPYC